MKLCRNILSIHTSFSRLAASQKSFSDSPLTNSVILSILLTKGWNFVASFLDYHKECVNLYQFLKQQDRGTLNKFILELLLDNTSA